jgi:predicted phosphate transport protein (TIGR00153 family)
MSLWQWFIPQDKVFFDLFEQQVSIVSEAGHKLVNLTKDFTNVKEKRHEIELLEHRGDDITHAIYERLNRTRNPPLTREEISSLASSLDEVLDFIDGSAEKMVYYGIESSDTYMVELAKLIHLSTVEIDAAVKNIRSIKDPSFIRDRCIEINRLENLADDVLAEAITNLFRTKDAMTIIKMKDIYDWLEIATDECEDVADVLTDIAFRHSSS